jgi:CheY-like chemotaxis protein
MFDSVLRKETLPRRRFGAGTFLGAAVYAGVAAFAVTGLGQAEDVHRAREAGFAGHFVKPVDVAALDRRIREWLAARGSGAGEPGD